MPVAELTNNLGLKEENYPLRPPEVVMDIKRLGSLHQSRLSFMRALMRKIMRQQWRIEASLVELDRHGYGTVVYTIHANENTYSYVLFSNYLADEERSDRVLAEKWDVTMALCMGSVGAQELEQLRVNVPKQEMGRVNSKVMVLSRGNKSSRNFEYVVSELSAGRQPELQHLADVGYLYRTTAVYGSGKFGMADWEKVKNQCPEFADPFAAEMFNCFLLRHFSLEQAEHLARIRSPETAVALQDHVKRFFGIGNSTGLGMAPYLVRHPLLISRWIMIREKTLARAIHAGPVDQLAQDRLLIILARIAQHFAETTVPDEIQIERNRVLKLELAELSEWLIKGDYQTSNSDWTRLQAHVTEQLSLETQEAVNSALIELYPDLVDEYECYPCVDEAYQLAPEMTLSELKALIEQHYGWALQINFSQPDANHYFWYRSEEKMEPRIGKRFSEPGQDKAMPLTIARQTRQCYDGLLEYLKVSEANTTVAQLLLKKPELGSTIKRIQTMAHECYGEIRGNLADKEMLPLDLLRCKLSFFGVSKFDPKSKLWVRNTMFQGAPLVSDIGQPFADDWYFPVAGLD